MFVELVSALRCPAPHEETWLVAASDRSAGRSIVEGVLGCPVCLAEYPIRAGVAVFDAAADGADAPAAAPDDEEVMRLAALLDLASAGGLVVLGGEWAACAPPLAQLTDAGLLLVNAADTPDAGERISAIRARALPLAAGSARAVALDAHTATPDLLASAVRALRPLGRLVAPSTVPLPAGVTELARDDRHWVAERVREAAVSAPVSIGRR